MLESPKLIALRNEFAPSNRVRPLQGHDDSGELRETASNSTVPAFGYFFGSPYRLLGLDPSS
jgi:hypothetical protein